jgi:Na+/proline symporter
VGSCNFPPSQFKALRRQIKQHNLIASSSQLNAVTTRPARVLRKEVAHVDGRYLLPVGLKGVLVASFLAAYMSTVSTPAQLGHLLRRPRFYRRFVRADAPERHYVLVGRLVTGLLMLVGALITFVLDSARESFQLMMSIGAGTGLSYLLRWFWWTITSRPLSLRSVWDAASSTISRRRWPIFLPSMFRLLAETIRRAGIDDIKPRIIICGAEMLDPIARSWIESTFEVKTPES